ncbi:MAG: CHASE domain-containing protein [Alphaproteobacteria bacterium]|nr:CHASE domain-containing protein [Alphaproteobacteria bacterium]
MRRDEAFTEVFGQLTRALTSRWAPPVVTGIVLAATAWAAYGAFQRSHAAERADFDRHAEHVRASIEREMLAHEVVLRGAASFLARAWPIAQADWVRYVAALDISGRYAGIRAFGVSAHVPESGRAAHEDAMRQAGTTLYAIRPQGVRDVYLPVVALAPPDLSLLGFDQMGDPARRAAAESARLQESPRISRRVMLADEAPGATTVGVIMFAPVVAAAGTAESAFRGHAFAAFRAGDLLASLVSQGEPGIRVRVHDGAGRAADLLYDSHPGEESGAKPPLFAAEIDVQVSGNTWTLVLETLPAFEAAMDLGEVSSLALGGILVAELLWIALVMARRREESSRRFLDFAEQGSDWFWEQDAQGKLTWLSRRHAAATGILDSAMLGKRWTEVIAAGPYGARLPSASESLASAIAAREAFRAIALTVRRPDGGEAAVRLSGRPNLDGSGAFQGYRGIGADVTDEVEAAAALLRAKTAAEDALADLKRTQGELVEAAKLASLSHLVAGVAHEINTPIGNAIAAASTLEDVTAHIKKGFEAETLTHEELADAIRTLRASAGLTLRSAERAAALVAGFKRVAVDAAEDPLVEFDLRSLLEETLAALDHRLRAARVRAVLACEGGIAMVSHPGALAQVLTALAVNAAAHAFPDGRSGTLSVAATPRDDGMVRIVVADDGVGLPADVVSRLFEPFVRLKRSGSGSGLGLHIARNVVVGVLRGRIALDRGEEHETPGVKSGARFAIDIPLILS